MLQRPGPFLKVRVYPERHARHPTGTHSTAPGHLVHTISTRRTVSTPSKPMVFLLPPSHGGTMAFQVEDYHELCQATSVVIRQITPRPV